MQLMEINADKSTLSTHKLDVEETRHISVTFPFWQEVLDGGLKYLGFFLKPNDYLKKDWKWLLEKLDKRLKSWSHKWLSRGGRLVLVKAVLEAIPVYWMSLSWIPKGIPEEARRICFRFL